MWVEWERRRWRNTRSLSWQPSTRRWHKMHILTTGEYQHIVANKILSSRDNHRQTFSKTQGRGFKHNMCPLWIVSLPKSISNIIQQQITWFIHSQMWTTLPPKLYWHFDNFRKLNRKRKQLSPHIDSQTGVAMRSTNSGGAIYLYIM